MRHYVSTARLVGLFSCSYSGFIINTEDLASTACPKMAGDPVCCHANWTNQVSKKNLHGMGAYRGSDRADPYGGFQLVMGVPLYRWMVYMEKPILLNGWFGGTPILSHFGKPPISHRICMYGIYGLPFTINIPHLPYMDPMGYGKQKRLSLTFSAPPGSQSCPAPGKGPEVRCQQFCRITNFRLWNCRNTGSIGIQGE